MRPGIVVVGAGQAGVTAAAVLRREGYEGGLMLVGDEPDRPYQRPPLSKNYLMGVADEAALELRSACFYRDNDIDLRVGCEVTAIDRGARTVALADGAIVPYSALVLATGATSRQLTVPGHDLDGVFTLRTLDDARRLRECARRSRRIVVVGGGFVGLEFAAAMSGRSDVSVTLIDVANRLLGRAVSSHVSRHVASVHGERGVRLVLDTGVAEFLGGDGAVTGVRDSDGRVHDADLVIVGVGGVPQTSLAQAAGLAVDNGITVDGGLRTSDSRIWAIGDCACRLGVRLESVQNAADQATFVARTLLGTQSGDYDELPWFWSDQKGLRLQMAGVIRADDDFRVLGPPSSGRFSVLAFRDERLVAVESVNRPADHMAARRILSGDTPVRLSDFRSDGNVADLVAVRASV